MTMQSSAALGQRPVAITVICIIIAVLLVLGVIGIIGLMTAAGSAGVTVPAWSLIWSIANIVLTGIAIYGLWIMKKWGLYLYTALFVIGVVMSLMIGGVGAILSIVGSLIPLAIVIICWVYQARMT
jgi:hypothetical protein